MKIFEIVNKYEIVDLDAINAQSLKEHLLNNPNLYENDANYTDARKFLDLHRTQVPTVGDFYVYAGVNVIPYLKFIQINYFKELQELKKLDNNYAFFQIENKIKGFPENSSLKGDALSQIYFFNSKDEYDKFIMLLELKFSDYKISYKALDQITTENFADGKKPGRKGLSKRVGIPKNASVTRLRQIAKNSTGEKQRMAH